MSAKLLKRQYFDLHLILINGQQNSTRVSQFKNFKISKSQNSMASVEFYVKQARTSICWNTTGKMTNQWCLWRKTALFVIHPPTPHISSIDVPQPRQQPMSIHRLFLPYNTSSSLSYAGPLSSWRVGGMLKPVTGNCGWSLGTKIY